MDATTQDAEIGAGDRFGNDGPYSPRNVRTALEEKYGAENVRSSTVPNNPLQRVNSNPAKGITVITDGAGGKAVQVVYSDPVTGDRLVANIPYDARGLPVMDSVSKFTTTIDKSVSYEDQFGKATEALRDQINAGRVDPAAFTDQQLQDIEAGRDKITDFTWYHNAQSGPNSMQLLPTAVHGPVLHIGEGALSKGV